MEREFSPRRAALTALRSTSAAMARSSITIHQP
jgi:hypothetical protein